MGIIYDTNHRVGVKVRGKGILRKLRGVSETVENLPCGNYFIECVVDQFLYMPLIYDIFQKSHRHRR